MPLVLRNRHDRQRIVQADARGCFRLEGEHRWVVEGDEELIALALADLRDVGERVAREVLHVDFGNRVGVFRVRGLGTLEVVSGKWDETHFESMLADLARIASALPFAAGDAGPLPYDRSLAARDDLLYHAYVYIRHILSEAAPRGVRLLPALRAIVADPHRATVHVAVDVATERLQRVDADTILALAQARGTLVRTRARGLPVSLAGHVPRVVPERVPRSSVDTPENRFVHAFLETVSSVVSRMKAICTKNTAFAHRVQAECRALEEMLAPWVRHPLWRDVGVMTRLPSSSTVLQRRRGYRDVYRHFSLLRLATAHLPISAHEARDLLEGKDIASLYELWSYFQVVAALTEILGPPAVAQSLRRTELRADVAREFEVRWSSGVMAVYNATFSRTKKNGRETYSLPLRPDVVVVLPSGVVHVLDAKFRLEWLPGADEEKNVDRARAKLDDVYKMHAYRDAIERAASAWVLYPGTEQFAFTPAAYDARAGISGVGALPLRPEAGGAENLRSLMRGILG